MKKLLKYLGNYKKETVLAPLFKMLEAIFELFVPIVMSEIINEGIVRENNSYIWQMGLVLVGLGVVGLVSSVTAQFFAAKAAVGFSTELKRELFKHIEHFSYSQADKVGTSTLITRLTSDVNQVQTGVNMVLRLFLRSPFIVFGAMIMAFTVDVKAALIFVVAIPLLSLVVFGIMMINIPLFKWVQAALDKVLLSTRENLKGVRVIRAFNTEEKERKTFETRNDALTKVQIFAGRIAALMNPITYVIVNVALILIIKTGAVRVDTGIIEQGDLVAILNYMSMILVELVKLANLIIIITKSVASGNRITDIFDMKENDLLAETGSYLPSEGVVEKAKGNVVVFDHVSLTYPGAGDESLTDIDFTAGVGETVGIIGGTGSGKSSLVQLIPHFYEATKGGVYVNGKNVKDIPDGELRSLIGYVPQKAVLFAGSIKDNIKWGNEDASDEDVLRALEAAQAKDFVLAKDGGINFKINQGGKNVSGGQKQRLTIARALVRDPKILILDDSASALDYATDAALRKAIAETGKDKTVFIVSQRTASVRHADKIIVLDDGEVVGIGSHDQLVENCSVYKEIYESQLTGKEAK
ncbi:MAG: ABC transporter ATP-binding protein/permease [Lachnospiraceae bacterium]|nr:ABC transporter ATP-binding protein/permease [Lachnospiraceae bacterium]